MTGQPLRRIEYFVSRFPRTSETFIVRELDALASGGRYEVGVRSLFGSPDKQVHDIAKPWVPKVVRPGRSAVLKGLLWAAFTHPLVLLRIVAIVVRSHRNVSILARALVTVAIACGHARDLRDHGGAVHIHAHYATYPALAAWVCQQLTGITYSFTAHAHDLYVDQSMLGRKVADAEFIATISRFNQDFIAAHCPDASTEVALVHCGIDTARYPFRERSIPVDGPIRALTVASLQEYKGHEYLLRALALGGDNSPRLEVTLIGGGPLHDELSTLATELGISDRVRFLGSQTEDVVRAELAACDLFVLPSIVAADGQMEGLPVALMESLASGVPTVSTRLSGIPELVVDGVTGQIAEPADAESLRDAIDRAAKVADPAAVATAGRNLVEAEFELGSCVGGLIERFDRLNTR